jgi:hypothetical protein
MKKTLLFSLTTALLVGLHSYAQESTGDTVASALARMSSDIDVFKRLKISGYLQPQYQVADMADSMGIANGITSYAGGNFGKGIDKRFMLRRARVKFQYDTPLNEKGFSTSQYVFQIDATERGLTIKDMYAKITDPWSGWFSVTIGNQNRPFGFEIGYSSSLRESPERGRMSQIIFPNERDMGAMLTIQGPKLSMWNWIKLEAGLFNGTGGPGAPAQTVSSTPFFLGSNTSDFDKYKDFIGHLSITRATKSEKVSWGLGASIYRGGFRIDYDSVYSFKMDSTSIAGFALEKNPVPSDFHNRQRTTRNHIGFDGQINIEWTPGITTLRAEYIEGEQPAIESSTTSPAAAVSAKIFSRNFNGAYFYFLQNIMQSPWQVIIKYDWYDPNTDVEGDEIGIKVKESTFKSTGAADIKYSTLGMGLAYRWDSNVKITAYYDKVENETSTNLIGYGRDLKDDVFTLRLQYKF